MQGDFEKQAEYIFVSTPRLIVVLIQGNL